LFTLTVFLGATITFGIMTIAEWYGIIFLALGLIWIPFAYLIYRKVL
jgi:hypothetical protein